MAIIIKVKYKTTGIAAWVIALFWRLVGRVAGIVKSKDPHAPCQAKAVLRNLYLEISCMK